MKVNSALVVILLLFSGCTNSDGDTGAVPPPSIGPEDSNAWATFSSHFALGHNATIDEENSVLWDQFNITATGAGQIYAYKWSPELGRISDDFGLDISFHGHDHGVEALFVGVLGLANGQWEFLGGTVYAPIKHSNDLRSLNMTNAAKGVIATGIAVGPAGIKLQERNGWIGHRGPPHNLENFSSEKFIMLIGAKSDGAHVNTTVYARALHRPNTDFLGVRAAASWDAARVPLEEPGVAPFNISYFAATNQIGYRYWSATEDVGVVELLPTDPSISNYYGDDVSGAISGHGIGFGIVSYAAPEMLLDAILDLHGTGLGPLEFSVDPVLGRVPCASATCGSAEDYRLARGSFAWQGAKQLDWHLEHQFANTGAGGDFILIFGLASELDLESITGYPWFSGTRIEFK